jgi:hypothetical protein
MMPFAGFVKKKYRRCYFTSKPIRITDRGFLGAPTTPYRRHINYSLLTIPMDFFAPIGLSSRAMPGRTSWPPYVAPGGALAEEPQTVGPYHHNLVRWVVPGPEAEARGRGGARRRAANCQLPTCCYCGLNSAHDWYMFNLYTSACMCTWALVCCCCNAIKRQGLRRSLLHRSQTLAGRA